MSQTRLIFRRVIEGNSAYDKSARPPRISSSAFLDREFQPSVDCSNALALNGLDARFTQKSSRNGVVAIDVRDVESIQVDGPGNVSPRSKHGAEVVPEPLNESEVNPAHHVVRLAPVVNNQQTFRRLSEQLARRATWAILPEDCRAASAVSLAHAPVEPALGE